MTKEEGRVDGQAALEDVFRRGWVRCGVPVDGLVVFIVERVGMDER
jgi:hypothetical protein